MVMSAEQTLALMEDQAIGQQVKNRNLEMQFVQLVQSACAAGERLALAVREGDSVENCEDAIATIAQIRQQIVGSNGQPVEYLDTAVGDAPPNRAARRANARKATAAVKKTAKRK